MDYLEYGTGLAAILAGGGAALGFKYKSEPEPYRIPGLRNPYDFDSDDYEVRNPYDPDDVPELEKVVLRGRDHRR